MKRKNKKNKRQKMDMLKAYQEIEKEEIRILKRMTVKESIQLTEILLSELSKWKR